MRNILAVAAIAVALAIGAPTLSHNGGPDVHLTAMAVAQNTGTDSGASSGRVAPNNPPSGNVQGENVAPQGNENMQAGDAPAGSRYNTWSGWWWWLVAIAVILLFIWFFAYRGRGPHEVPPRGPRV